MQHDTTAPRLAFEDFPPGRVIQLGRKTITSEEIRAFAAKYDPQPMHLDEEAGRQSILGSICASGFHTCSILMRLMHEAYLRHSTMQGSPGVDKVSWPHPVRPGDTLTGTYEVLEARLSQSRPGLGILRNRHRLVNQEGTLVLEMLSSSMLLTREAAS